MANHFFCGASLWGNSSNPALVCNLLTTKQLPPPICAKWCVFLSILCPLHLCSSNSSFPADVCFSCGGIVLLISFLPFCVGVSVVVANVLFVAFVTHKVY